MYKSQQTEKELKEFSNRLGELLNEHNISKKQHGRYVELSKLCGLSEVAVRKWLEGINYPKNDKMRLICARFNVNFEWLRWGKGPKYGKSEGMPNEKIKKLISQNSEYYRSLMTVQQKLKDLESEVEKIISKKHEV